MTPTIDIAEQTKIIAARMNSGQDTYAGRLDGWHLLGNVAGRFQTYREIEVAAKADFEVFKSQLRDGLGRPVNAWGTFRWNRTDIQAGNKSAATFLGVVGKDYTVIPHALGFSPLDNLVDAIGGAHYETMGTLDYGRIVWAQVDPNVSIRVGDDVSSVLLTAATSHDGSMALEVYETIYRAVCRNTLRAGSLNRLSATLRVAHRKNAHAKIRDIKAEIGEINSKAMDMQTKLNWLASKRVTREGLETVISRLFPLAVGKESSTRRNNVLTDILAKFESNDSGAFPEQAGTSYALLNAITDYTDHSRSVRLSEDDKSSGVSDTQARALSATFGTGDALKTSALEAILLASEDMPTKPVRGPSVAVDWSELGISLPATAQVV